MTAFQRKFLESRVLLAALLVAVTLLQENALLVRTAFALVGLYGLHNWKTLSEIERIGPRLVDVLSASTWAKYWLGGIISAEILFAYHFLFTGQDLGEYLNGFGSLFLTFLVPLAPVLCLHQRKQFLALRHAP